ncbi:MAG: hypothetical protein V5789_14600 [Colwellia sp.]
MKKTPQKNQFKKIVAILFINVVILSYIGLQTDDERYQDALDAYQDQNFTKTFNIMSSLAGKESPDAEYFLSTLYAKGHGVQADKKLAASWLEKAAKHGSKDAKESLKNNTIPVN